MWCHCCWCFKEECQIACPAKYRTWIHMCNEPGLEIILSCSLFHIISFLIFFHADCWPLLFCLASRGLSSLSCNLIWHCQFSYDNSYNKNFHNTKDTTFGIETQRPKQHRLVNVYNILAQVLSKNRLILAGKWKISIGIVRQNNIPNIVFILLFIVIIIISIDVAMRVYLWPAGPSGLILQRPADDTLREWMWPEERKQTNKHTNWTLVTRPQWD